MMHTHLEPMKVGANIIMGRLRRLRDHAHTLVSMRKEGGFAGFLISA